MQSHSRDRLDGDDGDGGASLQFRALVRKPATPTPVVEVYAWWFPMLSSRRGKKSASRLVVDPGAAWGRSEAVQDEQKGGRLWAFFPHFVGSLLDSTCSQKYRKEQERKRGDDYVRLFNTKGSKTNTEMRRRALARPVIDNVPDRVLPFVMRQPFSKLR